MKQKRRPLTPSLAQKWAEMAHLLFIDALSSSTPMAIEQIAFHGGTNLHLSWGSPRYSEDLDFLVNRDIGPRIQQIMPRIERRMQVLAKSLDPDLKVEISDRTRDGRGLLNFRIVLSSPMIVGQVMAKAEFWQVDADYLNGYETKFVRPAATGDIVSRITQPIPAATLHSAFADKVVALGNRTHLKWRDLFDLWWIDGQEKIATGESLSRIIHHASAYSTAEGTTLADGLRRFLERDPEEVFAQADPDLKRWLPKTLWDTLHPQGIREIVEHARRIAGEAAALLDAAQGAPAVPKDQAASPAAEGGEPDGPPSSP